MPKIIVLDELAPEGMELLAAAEGVSVEVRTGLKGDDLKDALANAEGAICRSGVKITAASLEGNRRLKAIVRAGVGTDNIDKQAATRLGIVVMNTPAGNTLSTAEHTFALMLALSRNIAPAYQSLCQGRWDRSSFTGTQLADKTLGVVGLGRIGLEVAKRARAFGMRVLGYDPFLTAERAAELGIEPIGVIADMFPLIDYLTVHTPLTPETENLINLDTLAVLKPGARLINCARGGIYNEAALVAGLKSGKLAGVALDVFAEEPCTKSELFGMPGVLCTPHLGASTEEAQTQVAVEAVDLLTKFLRNGEIRHAVNVAAVDPKTLESLRGFLDVAYRLGLFMAQWNSGEGITGCQLTYRGEVAARDTKLLTAAFCTGLLQSAMEEPVNLINAQLLLQERGIEVATQTRSERSDFSSAITAEITTTRSRYVAGATLFGENMPRLIRLGEHRLEAYLDGVLMIFRHQDVPGIVGTVGTALGRHQVNIGQMAVGRASKQQGGQAIGVLNLDTPPSAEAMREISQHPAIDGVDIIQLPSGGDLPSWLT